MAKPIISESVGTGGENQKGDTKLVQRLLNDARVRDGMERLKVDGVAGPKTNAAIVAFQSDHNLAADGRVDPDGPTIKALWTDHLVSLQASVITPYVADGLLGPYAPPDQGKINAVLEDYIDALKS